ncbi:Uncharacterized HTH-type transcriptional regulator HI_1476 [Phocoenobacter uteri]|uniref:Uncharacterized HTH-type transcriptional regulator HI_1476 n=1 Tax=Phocoenobacter uteri TaxID=146806 RepID=A0A379CBA7_9PAST|nr:S24 family peptidase [Phocoenobacter uteri]MDG6880969.1 transcriptional regulator [Phocoenobacter uteri]SUB58986.1 Uncharacterized HTH-type transcriptional regulator HI_1476 [Phocoenobacter uteri]
MNTIAERLAFIMRERGLKQEALAEKSETSQVTISNILSGKTKQPRNLFQLATALNVDVHWLQTGEGDYNSYPDVDVIEKDKDYSDEYVSIDLYDVKLSAGNGAAVIEWIPRKSEEPLLFQRAWFKSKRLCQADCKAMYVRGHSMYPVLQDWDTVIVDTSDTDIIDGEIYALAYKNNLYIKQVVRTGDSVELISFNTEYAPVIIKEDDLPYLQVIGRKVWRGG